MSVVANRVTVTDVVTPLTAADTDRNAGSACAIKNLGAVAIAIGGPTVTFATGYPLAAGAEVGIDFSGSAEILYAIADAATSTECAVLRTGV